MTTKPDLKQRLAALYATLAGATTECPVCKGSGEIMVAALRGYELEPPEPTTCSICQGTGEVARFPEFRQECDGLGRSWSLPCAGAGCHKCGGCRWQVRAGDSADGLAGLSRFEASNILFQLSQWLLECHDPMPSPLAIRVKELELICDAAGLDDDGELRSEVVERLRASLDTPREKLLTADQMRQKLDDEAAGLEVPDA